MEKWSRSIKILNRMNSTFNTTNSRPYDLPTFRRLWYRSDERNFSVSFSSWCWLWQWLMTILHPWSKSPLQYNSKSCKKCCSGLKTSMRTRQGFRAIGRCMGRWVLISRGYIHLSECAQRAWSLVGLVERLRRSMRQWVDPKLAELCRRVLVFDAMRILGHWVLDNVTRYVTSYVWLMSPSSEARYSYQGSFTLYFISKHRVDQHEAHRYILSRCSVHWT